MGLYPPGQLGVECGSVTPFFRILSSCGAHSSIQDSRNEGCPNVGLKMGYTPHDGHEIGNEMKERDAKFCQWICFSHDSTSGSQAFVPLPDHGFLRAGLLAGLEPSRDEGYRIEDLAARGHNSGEGRELPEADPRKMDGSFYFSG